jgi:hypothetical protein
MPSDLDPTNQNDPLEDEDNVSNYRDDEPDIDWQDVCRNWVLKMS